MLSLTVFVFIIFWDFTDFIFWDFTDLRMITPILFGGFHRFSCVLSN